MPNYSNMIQQAQQSAKSYYGQGSGVKGEGGKSTNFDKIKTSDPYQSGQLDLQENLLNYYENLIGQQDMGFQDTGLKELQDFQTGEDLERIRTMGGQMGQDPSSGMQMAGQALYLGQSGPRKAEALGRQRQDWFGQVQQGAGAAAYGGRGTGYTPVRTAESEAQRAPHGGGGSFSWMDSGPSASEKAYEKNTGLGYQTDSPYAESLRKPSQVR